MSARCGSCKAEIDWGRTAADKPVPIDAVPVEDGNLAVRRDDDGQLRTRVVRLGDPLEPDEKRGSSHFATCPNADRHRKPRTPGTLPGMP